MVRDIFGSGEPSHMRWNIQWPYILEKISVSNNRL